MSDPCDDLNPGWLSDKPELSRLLDNVQVQCPGVTSDLVTLVAWNTLEDFYQRSTYRREHIYWRMDPGIISINFDPYDREWRAFKFLDFRGLSNPKFEAPALLRDLTCPCPDTTRDGEVLLALKPASIKTRFPYDIWTVWFETLLAGVVGRLYMMAGKPFSDPNMARVHLAKYSGGVARARAAMQSGNLTDGVMWRFPYFAIGRPKSGGWGG